MKLSELINKAMLVKIHKDAMLHKAWLNITGELLLKCSNGKYALIRDLRIK
jgi:hypothetical protein